jgi:hypothetical protein
VYKCFNCERMSGVMVTGTEARRRIECAKV